MRKPAAPAGQISSAALVTLTLLVALPACAVSRLHPSIDWPILVGAPTLLGVATFFSYRSDKHRAQSGGWRIPEITLHLLALLGGWPGAFLAQQRYRHKTAKLSFQLIFWGTVLVYQLVALDSLLGWSLSSELWRAFAA